MNCCAIVASCAAKRRASNIATRLSFSPAWADPEAMSQLHAIVVWLTYPLALSTVLLLAGLLALAFRRRVAAVALVVAGLGWSTLWSLPLVSDALRTSLERTTPSVAVHELPRADAIVVLAGGGGYARMDREGVELDDLHDSSRIGAGARAWLAGSAPVVILSGGVGPPGHREADNMARVITRLGVPRSSLLLEDRSHSTRENAAYTARLARAHAIRRVVLVTSAIHMPRASLLFRQAGLDVIPLAVPERPERDDWQERWLPSRRALWRSGRAFKEYAGLLGASVAAPLGGAGSVPDGPSAREGGAKKKT
jgi:uncharacterized SAM-binding protein YcdF (DUF218 family)